MLEPESEAESNLRIAVELGQKLLQRNQQLLEDQLVLQRRVEDRNSQIKELQTRVRMVADAAARDADVRIQAALDRCAQLEEQLRAETAARQRDREQAAQVAAELESCSLELRFREQDHEVHERERKRMETQIDSLLAKVATLEAEVKNSCTSPHQAHPAAFKDPDAGPSQATTTPTLFSTRNARKSFHELDAWTPAQKLVDAEQWERVKLQLSLANARCAKLEEEKLELLLLSSQREAELERAKSAEAKLSGRVQQLEEILIMANNGSLRSHGSSDNLRSNGSSENLRSSEDVLNLDGVGLSSGKDDVQTFLELLSPRPHPSMTSSSIGISSLSSSSPSSSISPHATLSSSVSTSCSTSVFDSGVDDLLSELVRVKTHLAMRMALDEEFTLRLKKLSLMFEAASIAGVDREMTKKGQRLSEQQMIDLSFARLDAVSDQAKFLVLSNPDLPFSKVVGQHLQTCVELSRANAVALVELQRLRAINYTQTNTPPKPKKGSFLRMNKH